MEVRVVVGPRVVADPDLLRQVAEAELAALAVDGRLVTAADPADLRRRLASAADQAAAVVALPGGDPAARELMREPGRHADRTVWLDLTVAGPAVVAGAGAHLYGRGVWGVAWAIRHAVHRVRQPAHRIRYGTDPDQWADLRRPVEPSGARAPVAVLVHGGFWRSIWGADLMDALAIDLAGHGFAAWNLEYRRPDRHGWAATTADVAAGIAALAAVADEQRLDLDRVAVLGHSAGGQLALRAAADIAAGTAAAETAAAADTAGGNGARVALAVSLAGVLDLAEGHRRALGTGAVAAALGGTPDQAPEVYAAADPLARLPLRVPQLVVQGREDDLDLVEINRRYARAAHTAGDEVRHLEHPGDHFSVIDPGSEIWRVTRTAISERLGVTYE